MVRVAIKGLRYVCEIFISFSIVFISLSLVVFKIESRRGHALAAITSQRAPCSQHRIQFHGSLDDV